MLMPSLCRPFPAGPNLATILPVSGQENLVPARGGGGSFSAVRGGATPSSAAVGGTGVGGAAATDGGGAGIGASCGGGVAAEVGGSGISTSALGPAGGPIGFKVSLVIALLDRGAALIGGRSADATWGSAALVKGSGIHSSAPARRRYGGVSSLAA